PWVRLKNTVALAGYQVVGVIRYRSSVPMMLSMPGAVLAVTGLSTAAGGVRSAPVECDSAEGGCAGDTCWSVRAASRSGAGGVPWLEPGGARQRSGAAGSAAAGVVATRAAVRAARTPTVSMRDLMMASFG